MPLNVVLYQPEIPPNTGSVIRLCANTGAKLHLIEPLGFRLDDAKLRRAGLDYHEFADVAVHPSLDVCLEEIRAPGPEREAFGRAPTEGRTETAGRDPRVYALTTRATRRFFDATFNRGDVVVFGPETRGLPDAVLNGFPESGRLRVPMRPEARSLNLANAVAVVVYEAWRQLGFEGAR